MKIFCNRDTLAAAVGTVSKAVASKSPMTVLEGVYMSAKGSELLLAGNDMTLAIECTVPASVEKPGRIVLSCRTLSDILRRLPDGTVEISVSDDFKTTIVSKTSVYKIMGLDASEYPLIPAMDARERIQVDSHTMRAMLRGTSFASAIDDPRPVLNGVYFEISGEKLTVAALDGYRLAMCRQLVHNKKDSNFIIPIRTVNELIKILPDSDAPVYINMNDKHACLEFENTRIYTRLIEGEYVDFKKMIPGDMEIKCVVKAEQIREAVERVEPIVGSDASKYPLRLSMENDRINVFCITPLGQVNDVIEIPDCGGTLEIGFNYRYFLEAVSAAQDDELLLEFRTSISPCVIRPVEGDEYLYMVLPVRLK